MLVERQTRIRDFRVRGGYFNQHSRRFRKDRYLGAHPAAYLPPIVDFVTGEGRSDSMVVSEVDIPLLCQHDYERAKSLLGSILDARAGDRDAAAEVAAALQRYPWLTAPSEQPPPQPTRFVVPSTSGDPHSDTEISQKAFVLLKLTQLGYSVPDFAVVTAAAYDDRANLERHVGDAIAQLEVLTMQSLRRGDPLVFALRCATPRYIPGVMDTYLNVGVTERSLSSLEHRYGPLAAGRMFVNNLRNLATALEIDVEHETGGAAEPISHVIDRLLDRIGKRDRRLLEDPFYQAVYFARLAYRHYEENLDLVATLCRGTEHAPSLILQKMVCTVRHESAYAGVLYSRHTQTGEGMELQAARNIFGEEIMTGTAEIHSTAFAERDAIKEQFPAVYHVVPQLPELEREFESPVTIEFAVEATPRYQWFALLQLNETGIAGRAALTAAVDMHKSGAISRQRVTQIVRPYHLKQLTSDTIDQEAFRTLTPFSSGVSVLPRSAVSARIFFSGEAALTAKLQGDKVCLCKKTFVPTDTVVMREMDAILSLTSAAVHVVTICQSLGIPALLNLEKNEVDLAGNTLKNSAGEELREGDWITISSRRHTVYQGCAKYRPARLLRYMQGEPVEMEPGEEKVFASVAYAYRYYQQLVRGLAVDQDATLHEVMRLVNFEFRDKPEEARKLVNGWFDERETVYADEVLKSDIGDHLAQSNVFEMLTLDRKIRFFKLALARCEPERISGYDAGAFMLGRFLSQRYPVAFWKRFRAEEIARLLNEWVLFEKYMQLLHQVGERRLLQARKAILKGGLEELLLHAGNVRSLITLKLSGIPLAEVRRTLPPDGDPQCSSVIELLELPYKSFYEFGAEWSVGELKKICAAENLRLPSPDDV